MSLDPQTHQEPAQERLTPQDLASNIDAIQRFWPELGEELQFHSGLNQETAS